MGRRIAIACVAAAAIVTISLITFVVAGRSIYSRAAFGTWDPGALPTRIEYCDRRYLPGSHVTSQGIDASHDGAGVLSFRQVGATADGKPIFARPLTDDARRKYGTPLLPCAMVVYLKVADDDYVAYGLSGGP